MTTLVKIRGALHGRRPHVGVVALAALALALFALLSGPGVAPRAAGASAAGGLVAQTDAAVPARDVTMLGSSPLEAPDETWGIGFEGSDAAPKWTIVRYASGAGWSQAPAVENGAGKPLASFAPGSSELAGSIAPDGSGALLGSVPGAIEPRELLLVRNPGQPFRETSISPPLEKGERLFNGHRAPMVAALSEGGGVGGALVVPISTEQEASEERVLHWDGTAWSSEPIEIPPSSRQEGGFRVLAIGASSPGNAWLLAQLSSQSDSVALFRRQSNGAGATWQPVAPAPGEAAGAPLTAPVAGAGNAPFTVEHTGAPPSSQAQLLTVTDQGVWVDGLVANSSTHLTMYFQPAPEGVDSGEVLASWCETGEYTCTYQLPESLPNGPSRSFAWSTSGSRFGERVITGLSEGVSLRLQGSSFTRVLALGGSEPPNDVGGTRGAAFASGDEGWLGSERLPVHITLASNEQPNLLQSYPVPFRRPVLAIAPQPGVEVGSLSSEALAVGEEGEVARFEPGAGWQPESLLNSAGGRETPQLRAVAWPTSNRAYAVGTEGQMWLWRGETGLWERDPATPLNFREDMLGIAFDPEQPSIGYAVGQGGTLLRFGKTWTQEPVCQAGESGRCIPAELAHASFTSVAFAGSEAIVAYRVPHLSLTESSSELHYTGGLLVNEGTGWHEDASAAAALATEAEDIPWAVGALPDGGAAFSAESGAGVPRVFERSSAGAAWEATTQPYPGTHAPGSLALFREGGSLRVVGAGGVPDTTIIDAQTPPPAGSPPVLIKGYPLASTGGDVFRQSANGWSDEQNDHNEVEAPPGSYARYDTVYKPDPIWAVLVDPTGAAGWAVGGSVEDLSTSDTADIARYPAEAGTPAGETTAPILGGAGEATFAIGGGAQCAAPCADRALAGIGPDVYLSSALQRAGAVQGLRAFVYTGPRVTTGLTEGAASLTVPYAREEERYASLLAGGTNPAFAAASPTDRPGANECYFTGAFSAFARPFGTLTQPGIEPTESPPEEEARKAGCASGQAAYYAFDSSNSEGKESVRVIMLDNSTQIGGAQLEWLERQLRGAASLKHPAIVVGSADLPAEIERHEPGAAEVARVLIQDGASAYFFDAPEQNVELQLKVGTEAIPAFGSGTLGYVSAVDAERQKDFLGTSGFLLARVEVAARKSNNVAPVTAPLIPDIGELSMEAVEGTLLRRSEAALFQGLARRPRAGGVASGKSTENESDAYAQIPDNCVGEACARGIFPEYTFSSSNPKVGTFVEPNLNSAERNAVLLNSKEQPIPDAHSGLLCAFNAGTTTVTISSGGLSASLPVTVEAGSVRRPCGTTPLESTRPKQPSVSAPAQPPAAGTSSPAPATAPPPLPAPPTLVAALHAPAPAVHVSQPPSFFVPPAPAYLVPAFLPPPLPAPANPTPPSGTSAVTSPVEAAQKEEEHEEATESVSNQAAAYSPSEHEPSPVYLLGIVLLAAFAGASVGRRRRGRRDVRVAPATITSSRMQRRWGDGRRRGL